MHLETFIIYTSKIIELYLNVVLSICQLLLFNNEGGQLNILSNPQLNNMKLKYTFGILSTLVIWSHLVKVSSMVLTRKNQTNYYGSEPFDFELSQPNSTSTQGWDCQSNGLAHTTTPLLKISTDLRKLIILT